jgi:hypothetical protein
VAPQGIQAEETVRCGARRQIAGEHPQANGMLA